MGRTRLRRALAPSDAERARSIAMRGGTATLVGTACPEPVTPLVHHVRADGSAILLLDDDEPLLEHVRRRGEEAGTHRSSGRFSDVSPGVVPPAGRREQAVMLELADRAPVDLREPVRGLLWITGWLWLPDPRAARRMALQVAEERPHDRLLDLGHGATLVRLDPGSAVLADGDGSAALSPVDLAAARPDPFCGMEDHWLGHLDRAHPEVLVALARHLPAPLARIPDARVRPLGVDRCGLRLRVETPEHDHDVRLGFEGVVTTPEELHLQMNRLAGCPGHGRAGEP